MSEREWLPDLDSCLTGVNVWVSRLDQCRDESLLRQYASLLSASESERRRRFLFEGDRHTYLVSHALVRSVIGQIAGEEPSRLTFSEGRNGKPLLHHALSRLGRIEFNLSHTDGLAILCTATNRVVGVDVEHVHRPAPLEVAQRYFSSLEVEELMQLPPEDRPTRFWSLWTLKEAYIKATGHGLSAELSQFSFSLSRPGALDFRISMEGFAECSRWWFAQWAATPMHLATICLEQPEAGLPEVRFWEVVPLRSARDVVVNFLTCGGDSAPSLPTTTLKPAPFDPATPHPLLLGPPLPKIASRP